MEFLVIRQIGFVSFVPCPISIQILALYTYYFVHTKDVAIIGGIIIICGGLLIIFYCKYRRERIRNINMSARAKSPEIAQEEQRSLSGNEQQQPQLLNDNTSSNQFLSKQISGILK